MTHTVSRRPLAAEAGILYHVGLLVDKLAQGQILLSVFRIFLSALFYQFSILIPSIIYHSMSIV
jgi:hypothetical protein